MTSPTAPSSRVCSGKVLRHVLLLVLFLSVFLCASFVVQVGKVWAAGPTFVQKIDAPINSTSPFTLTFGSNTTAGNAIVVWVEWQSASTVLSVTDTQGNTYTLIPGTLYRDSTNGYSIEMAYTTNIVGGADTLTVTLSSTSFNSNATAIEYSGIATSNPVDQSTNTTLSSSASPSIGPLTPTNSNDLAVTAFWNLDGTGGTWTAGSGYVKRSQTTYYYAVEDQTLSNTSAVSGTVTFNTPIPTDADMVLFKAVSSEGSDTTPPSTPTNLSATAISSSAISLNWTASMDNVGVTGYNIYRGGVKIGTSAINSYTDTGVSPSTLYTYTVSAYDAAGNTSAQSSSANATTQAVSAGRTFYIDYVTGSDSNNGTSKAMPWQHIPGMQGCVAICASITPKAGDNYILKGGVTWPNIVFPILWQWSGTNGNSIYIGVDQTWYTGAVWERPIFDAQGQTITGSGTHNNFFRAYGGSLSYVTLDNIEMRNFHWDVSNPVYGDVSYIALGGVVSGSTNLTLNHLYLHAWTHSNNSGSTADDLYLVLGDTNSPYMSGSIFENGIIDGSDGSSDSGHALKSWPSTMNSVIHDIANGILPEGHGTISGNLVYNITTSFSGEHENFLEPLASDGIYYIHDNVFHTGVGEAAFLGNPGETDYVWNNVWYDLQGNPPEIGQNGGGTINGIYFWNNTIEKNALNYCLRQGHTELSTIIVFENNHCITTESQATDPSLDATTIVVDHNLIQTPTTANGQGYTSMETYAYSPASTNNSTIGIGLNLNNQATGALTGLINDTNYACSVGAGNQVVCPVRTTISRPSSGPWDIGAYQYVSSGGGDTTPPSVPQSLSASPVSSSSISLTWSPSTDNIGVTGYKIYRGGVQIATSPTNSYSDTGLTASTQYSYTVSAYDAASNNSAQSSNASATTQASATPVPGDLNLDHIVNSLDFSLLNSKWNTNYPSYDLYPDGIINALDYAVMSSNWGKTW